MIVVLLLKIEKEEIYYIYSEKIKTIKEYLYTN